MATKTKQQPAKQPAAKPAKKPARKSAKRSNVLMERTDKVITKDGNTVLKVFGPSYLVSDILNEAMNEVRALEAGLPVAKVIEVMKLRGHWCIRREFIEGVTLADVMAADKKNLVKYLKEFVKIQCEIFTKTSPRMGNLADKLDRQISASTLEREIRYDLHMKLQSFPRGTALCHGDFNPTNVIIKADGTWTVIDWAHVRIGDPAADIARTYLLFWLDGHVVAAGKYMQLACEATKIALPDVQKYLPIVAAAETAKPQSNPKNMDLLMHWASVVDCS
ncbi:MAG: aminoglycoside phosphotransferase family protein [Kiritimatiellae bacterium]|nr:aminoglycoside phosphotransferase family protein [Kiritimatiellia bacterium]